MKTSEIRIGNFVHHPLTDDTFQISISGLSAFAINFVTYQPIPLTEEWLLKLGFIRKNGYGFIKKDLFGNLFYSVETKEHFMFQYHELRIKIDYVHQLQNLYFALTGEELTIKQ
jgi:hypothetical protein